MGSIEKVSVIARSSSYRTREDVYLPLVWILLTALFVFCVREAWIADDARITIATCRNFIEGRGLTWNPGVRVQAYTHPAWMFLLSGGYQLTGEPFYSVIAVGLVFSMAAACVLVRLHAPRPTVALVALVALAGCRSIVDYSTSGLENPLTHLLIGVFYWSAFKAGESSRRQLVIELLCFSLCFLTRPEAVLLFLPFLVFRGISVLRDVRFASLSVRVHGRLAALVLLGLLPLIAWEVFSIIYYGMFIPNTAVAKLSVPLGSSERWLHGMHYLLATLRFDPIGGIVVAVGLALGWKQVAFTGRLLVIGILLHLLYVTKIGGDFMVGRLYTPDYFACVVLWARAFQTNTRQRPLPNLVAALSLLVLSLSGPNSPFARGAFVPETVKLELLKDKNQIADEGAWHRRKWGLHVATAASGGPIEPSMVALDPTKPIERRGGLGSAGVYKSPEVWIIDVYALADPLLSRVFPKRKIGWRAGHHARAIPTGYSESMISGMNQIEDKGTARFYDQIRLITMGPLFTKRRWKAIFELNSGKLDGLIPQGRYYFANAFEMTRPKAGTAPAAGAEYSVGDTRTIPDTGVYRVFHVPKHGKVVEFSSDALSNFEVQFFDAVDEFEPLAIVTVYADYATAQKWVHHRVEVPSSVQKRGFSIIRILPTSLNRDRYVGHIALLPDEQSLIEEYRNLAPIKRSKKNGSRKAQPEVRVRKTP